MSVPRETDTNWARSAIAEHSSGHENLAVEVMQDVEQRGAAAMIEMGRDLVEQQHRRHAGHLAGQPRMRQHDPDEQGLLLAGGRQRGRHVLGPVADHEIGAMRSLERPAGGAVAVALGGEPVAKPFLDLDRREACQHFFHQARQRQVGARKYLAVGRAFDHGTEQPHHLGPGGRDRRAGLGHLRLDGGEPGPVARVFGKQPVTSAHRLFIGERAAPVRRVDRQHQPVEEAAPVRRRAGEKPVHGRRQPHHPQPFLHGVGRARRRAVDAHAPAGFGLSVRPVEPGMERETAGCPLAGHVAIGRPPQAAPRREQR